MSGNFRRPFIPIWMDDAKLLAVDFRVLAHLWRCDGPEGCFPGAANIRKKCRIAENTVWASLHRLEAGGFIRREKRFRNSNSYVLLQPVTAKEGVTQLPQKEGEHSPQTKGCQSPQTEGYQLPQKRGCNGSPVMVPHEGSPMRGGETPPPESESEWVKRLQAEYPSANIQRELTKADRYQRKKGGTLDRTYFEEVWLPKVGIQVSCDLTDSGPRYRMCEAESDGPAGWQACLAREYPDSVFSPGGSSETTDWHKLSPEARNLILEKMREPSEEPIGRRASWA